MDLILRLVHEKRVLREQLIKCIIYFLLFIKIFMIDRKRSQYASLFNIYSIQFLTNSKLNH